MFSTSILGYKGGPAFNKSKEVKLDDYWTIVGIPDDIPDKVAINNVKRFLTDIVSLEVPSSLMCNCNCEYCYIREKWLKNTIVSVEDIKHITELGFKHILNFESTQRNKVVSAWGAEPFCNMDTLEYLADFCKLNNLILNFSTNGTLLNDRIKKFLYDIYSNNIINLNKIKNASTIQVSLDGPKHIQDTYRPLYSGGSNYDNVMEFLEYLTDISNKLGYDRRVYHLCSTVYLGENSVDIYKDAIEFFTDSSNKKIYTPILPIRMENSKNYTKKDADIFYDMIVAGTDLLINKSKRTGEAYLDNHASSLFLNSSRLNGWARCSAMHTQVSLDLDGFMYLCHGPITTTKLKPTNCFGNIIEGIIDYRKYISVMDSIYGDLTFKAICKTCDLTKKCPGIICTSCPPRGGASNGEPVNFNIHMCNVYKRCLPLWESQYEQYLSCCEKGDIDD